jgi:hypothetical protein
MKLITDSDFFASLSGNMTLSTTSGIMSFKAGTDLDIRSATTLTLKSETTIDMDATTEVDIDSAIINLN